MDEYQIRDFNSYSYDSLALRFNELAEEEGLHPVCVIHDEETRSPHFQPVFATSIRDVKMLMRREKGDG